MAYTVRILIKDDAGRPLAGKTLPGIEATAESVAPVGDAILKALGRADRGEFDTVGHQLGDVAKLASRVGLDVQSGAFDVATDAGDKYDRVARGGSSVSDHRRAV